MRLSTGYSMVVMSVALASCVATLTPNYDAVVTTRGTVAGSRGVTYAFRADTVTGASARTSRKFAREMREGFRRAGWVESSPDEAQFLVSMSHSAGPTYRRMEKRSEAIWRRVPAPSRFEDVVVGYGRTGDPIVVRREISGGWESIYDRDTTYRIPVTHVGQAVSIEIARSAAGSESAESRRVVIALVPAPIDNLESRALTLIRAAVAYATDGRTGDWSIQVLPAGKVVGERARKDQ